MSLWNDLRYAARTLRHAPGFALTAIFTLAFGIGATTSTFSVADALLWKPAPLIELDPLVAVVQRVPDDPNSWNSLAPADLEDVRTRSTSFSSVTFWTSGLANLAGAGSEPERVSQYLVGANFFEVVGVHPALGRGFLPGEDEPGREQVVVLSNALWRRRFGGDPRVVGKNIRLDDASFLVAGVMPPKFEFPPSAELWTPMAQTPAERSVRDRSMFVALGRLAAGRTAAQAQAELDTLGAHLAWEYPSTNKNRRFMATPAHDFLIGAYTHQYVLLLFGAVLFVLLIACANVANLQFARALGRTREIALRTALGAGRRRVVAQLLTESTLISLAGALLGLLVARWSLDWIVGGMPPDVERFVPGWDQIHLDWRALAFTLAAALAAGILAGLVPAWQCSRPNLHETLRDGGRGATSGRAKHRLRGVLVAAEIAMSVVLLVGASLMVRGFDRLVRGGAQMEPAGLLTLRLAITANKYEEPWKQAGFYREVLERISETPAVKDAAAVTALPYSQHSTYEEVEIEGRAPEPGEQPAAMQQSVSQNYFSTLRIALKRGRLLDSRDGPDSPPVAVVSEHLAQRYWPGESPVGRRFRTVIPAGPGPWTTVVGEVSDVPHSMYDRGFRSVAYVPYQQVPRLWMDIAVRTAGDPMRAAPAVTAAIRGVDAEQPVADVRTMDTMMRHEATGLIYVAVMMGAFGILALALSTVGVYGVMAYLVGEQKHEIGIRVALGAPRSTVLAMVFRRGLATTAAGLAAGLALAFAMARVMASLIWGVSAGDLATFVGIPVALLAAAVVAIYVPARRAMKMDPIAALRNG